MENTQQQAIMSEDLRSLNSYPAFYNFTADTNLSEILLPSACTRVSCGGVGKSIYVCNTNAVDGSAPPSGKATVPKDNYLQLKLGRGINRPNSIFVAATSSTVTISVILEET